MSNPTPYNPAYQHPKMSATRYPLPTPPPVNVPPVGPASVAPPEGLNPNAAPAASPTFDPRYTNFATASVPIVGGMGDRIANGVWPVSEPLKRPTDYAVPTPAEARHAAVAERFLNGAPIVLTDQPVDKK